MMLNQLASELSHLTPADNEFDEILMQIVKLADGGDLEACLTVGHVLAQYPQRSAEGRSARDYYEQAARAGHPLAVERLADLYLIGEGVGQDQSKAYSMYSQLGAWMFPHVLCQLGYMELMGIGCEANGQIGLEHLCLAALQRDPLAIAWLQGVESKRQQQASESTEAGWQKILSLTGIHSTVAADDDLKSAWLNCLEADPEQLPAILQDLVGRNQLFDALPVEDALSVSIFSAETARCHSDPGLYCIKDALNGYDRLYLLHLVQQVMRSQDAANGAEAALLTLPDWTALPVQRVIKDKLATFMHMPVSTLDPLTVMTLSAGDQTDQQRDYLTQSERDKLEVTGDFRGQRRAALLMTTTEQPVTLELTGMNMKHSIEPGQVWVQYAVTPDGLCDHRSHYRLTNESDEPVHLIRIGVRERAPESGRYITL